MQRRRFLSSASLLAGASLLPLASPGLATGSPSRWQVLWVPAARAGEVWQPVHRACGVHCQDEALRVTVDAMHPAAGGRVISDFGLHAVFDLAGGHSARFTAWQMGGEGALRSESAGASFIAGRATLRRIDLDYRLGRAEHLETLSLVAAHDGLLSPGHYVLVGPRADGGPADTRGWTHSGDPARPLSGAIDVDVLAFRVESPA